MYTIEPITNPAGEGVEELLSEIKTMLQAVEVLIRDAKKPVPVVLIDQ